METHSQYLKRVVPPGRLFFYQLKDGWEPLCKILHVPVPGPEVEFPHMNERAEIEGHRQAILHKGAVIWLAIISSLTMFVGSVPAQWSSMAWLAAMAVTAYILSPVASLLAN